MDNDEDRETRVIGATEAYAAVAPYASEDGPAELFSEESKDVRPFDRGPPIDSPTGGADPRGIEGTDTETLADMSGQGGALLVVGLFTELLVPFTKLSRAIPGTAPRLTGSE